MSTQACVQGAKLASLSAEVDLMSRSHDSSAVTQAARQSGRCQGALGTRGPHAMSAEKAQSLSPTAVKQGPRGQPTQAPKSADQVAARHGSTPNLMIASASVVRKTPTAKPMAADTAANEQVRGSLLSQHAQHICMKMIIKKPEDMYVFFDNHV